MIKGAIFDLDGTLLDSMHLWVGIGARYVRTLGFEPTQEEADDMGGMMLEDMSAYIKEHYPTTLSEDALMGGINRLTEQGYFHEVEVKPHVYETLDQLSRMGVRMCLATATERYLTEAVLRRTNLARYFDRIFTAREQHTSKYEPEIFQTAREWLGTPQESTYVFEDTYHSIHGAKEAGFKVIAVADKWSAHRQPDIEDLADLFLQDLGELDLDQL